MPGLVGIFDLHSPLEGIKTLFYRMCNSITHEPWYQTHNYFNSSIAVVRVSLGITNPYPQPAKNEDGSILVWMDGEIYDFKRQELTLELKRKGHTVTGKGDAELVAHLYEEKGHDLFRELEGTFSVALFDSNTDKLVIAVDRDASRPLYYYSNNGVFLFACEVKAILKDNRISKKIDERGVIEFFTFRHVLADRTLLQGIHFLPAGYLAIYQSGKTRLQSYWMPTIVEDEQPYSYESYVDEIIGAVRRSLERQMYDKRHIGEFLSGGLDSRTLAGLAPLHEGHFHTFSRGPRRCWDVRFGEMVARRVGSQHHFLELSPDFLLKVGRKGIWLTDGLMTVNDIYMLGIIDQVKPYVDIVFLGNGYCDGILGGIALNDRFLRVSSMEEAAMLFFDHNGNYVPQSIQTRVFSKSFYQRTRGAAFEALWEMLSLFDGPTFSGIVEAFCLQCRWPRSANWGAILSRTQVETRYPYSDHQLCSLVSRVPARWRINRQMQLAVIKRSRPDLAQVPWDFTGLPVRFSSPKTILMMRAYYRARREFENLTRGLVPSVSLRERANYALWYRTILRSWLEEILLDERTLARGYYDEKGLRQLIKEHMSKRYDFSQQFGLLLTFELWNRLFIDGETP